MAISKLSYEMRSAMAIFSLKVTLVTGSNRIDFPGNAAASFPAARRGKPRLYRRKKLGRSLQLEP